MRSVVLKKEKAAFEKKILLMEMRSVLENSIHLLP